MSASRTALRLITILFLLAGILLLRKPVFGAVVTVQPTRFSVVIHGVAATQPESIASTTLVISSCTTSPPLSTRPSSSLNPERSPICDLPFAVTANLAAPPIHGPGGSI
jgi:hypothetical protein